MARYWTSDLHFGHYNVINYCKRPFKNVAEMNQALIDNWNKVVTEEDDVMFLGDWSLHHRYFAILKNLRFKHLYWVRGNHDRINQLAKMMAEFPDMQYLAQKVSIHDHMVVEIGGKQFWLAHRPLLARDDMPMICGHVHEKWKFLEPGVIIGEHSRHYDKATKKLTQPVLNVGCDQHNYTPISDEQVLEYFK